MYLYKNKVLNGKIWLGKTNQCLKMILGEYPIREEDELLLFHLSLDLYSYFLTYLKSISKICSKLIIADCKNDK